VLLPATDADLPFLRAMLAKAAFPPGTPRPADPLADDHVARYLDGWGRPGDLGLVAWEGSRRVGAAWTRRMSADRAGYGFVGPDVPELTVAVAPADRGRGLGRALVGGALDQAAAHGTARVSLSVADAVNPAAAHLYRTLGFAEVARDAGSITMASTTAPPPPADADAGEPMAREAGAADGPALARLREVMFMGDGLAGRPGWIAPFLTAWTDGWSSGAWRATVVDDVRGRPVAAALAVGSAVAPSPGREQGRAAHIGSVATEPRWRRRGCARAATKALVDALDADGVEWITLNATPEGEALYASLGFTASTGARHRSRPGRRRAPVVGERERR
jgi:ribosomal protein S18 acetylase RimI-like enzyme